MNYALIRNGKVKNVIVANDDFVALIKPKWDEVVRIDELEEIPGLNYGYNNGVFTPPPAKPAPILSPAEIAHEAKRASLREKKNDKSKINTNPAELKELLGDILEVLNL